LEATIFWQLHILPSSRLLTGASLRLLRCSNIHIPFEQSALTL
jgi:hypothetical protein